MYFTGNNARREEAKRIYRMPCCRDKCLHLIGKHRAYEVIESCINEVAGLGRDRKHQYLFQKLRNADANINELTGTMDKSNIYIYIITVLLSSCRVFACQL